MLISKILRIDYTERHASKIRIYSTNMKDV